MEPMSEISQECKSPERSPGDPELSEASMDPPPLFASLCNVKFPTESKNKPTLTSINPVTYSNIRMPRHPTLAPESFSQVILAAPDDQSSSEVVKGAEAPEQAKDDPLKDDADGPYISTFNCDICGNELGRTAVRVRCAECTDFDMCVPCFCHGSEKQNASGKMHLPNHSYVLVGRNTFPLLCKDWTADEELLLIDGVSKYGFGNWNEVAELVNQVALKVKRSGQCEQHYYSLYLNSATKPLPDVRQVIAADGVGVELQDEQPEVPVMSRDASRENGKPQQIAGYWPLRGDFDVEYDNEAELILADMEFKPDESPQERELKLQIIEIYNSKLDERIFRKKTIIERGLLDLRSVIQKDKKRTKEEKELHSLLKPLSRFHRPEEHERFVQLLIEEKRIRQRFSKLQEWRSLGLKTLEEVRYYEEEKKTRDELQVRGHQYFRLLMEGSQRYLRKNRGSSAKCNNEEDKKYDNITKASILTGEEKTLCENLQVPPVFYLLMKKILLQEAAARKDNIHHDSNINTSAVIEGRKVGRLYDWVFHYNYKQVRDCFSLYHDYVVHNNNNTTTTTTNNNNSSPVS